MIGFFIMGLFTIGVLINYFSLNNYNETNEISYRDFTQNLTCQTGKDKDDTACTHLEPDSVMPFISFGNAGITLGSPSGSRQNISQWIIPEFF